ncbi:Sec-independent protein translocase protein TatB [Yersinia aldovae]|uniref:Sec-independent protein translocase protein TatB n=1 Tax=Yersinia aldovae TaxID=29483 RepID=A0A0T9UJS5_YERAL|nr:Sec-independent protein translocase protein TatB [Yersinia aldovae]CNL26821.1 Sec-independent protein translocase protein TatB [Yersinia aldovae]CNL47138.1 Sec-independent protein translocase protein TatB [Yersinia aldovae]
MFDIGFSELLLILVIGLVVLGPERLPVAVRTVAGWIRTLRSLAATVQNELAQELKLQELQDSLKKAEQAGLQNLTPELKASMDELKEAAEALKRSYSADIGSKDPHTIHNPLVTEPEAIHDGVTPAESATQVSAAPQVPGTHYVEAVQPIAEAVSVHVEQPVVEAGELIKPTPTAKREPVHIVDISVIKPQSAATDARGTESLSADKPRIHPTGGDR